MIPGLILVISVAALLQFFVSYCRSLTAAYGKQELSEEAREVTGIRGRSVSGDDFRRLLQLLWLCPEAGDDGMEIRAVRGYHGLLRVIQQVANRMLPDLANWANIERQGCAYFAAVALDRRIAHNRDLLLQQTQNPY